MFKDVDEQRNKPGAGDYDLPDLIGQKDVLSAKTNPPFYSFKSKTKLSWFP